MTQDLIFSVPDMDCGGCVRAITEAVHSLDATASVAADLATKRVSIGTASAADFGKAIEDAGFTVVPGV
jgi:copper chaperone